jgi:excisionase family DNA binding protein
VNASDILVTAEEAAEEVGVKPATIYSWVNRGHLEHAEQRGHLKLFRLADVFAAEATRRRQHRRKTSR